ncbi:hypothetical protein BMF94_4419 [Rhodotorula taiwanensis]|uniref:Large ribosomal subunit protein uL15/eL18 domain-containing protein n=1 Tax=Rhodotorula taiwanensis TaxID=741276 RepID=A0A2S5B737_9BASI|nr:hypothetical protein BMF94_4419 [Rhodotorula taiwanensis]
MSLTRMLGRLSLQPVAAAGSRPLSTAALVSGRRPTVDSIAATSIRAAQTQSAALREATRRTVPARRAYATEASHLGNLSPHPGSAHKRKRIGRGIGSGKGGRATRGQKGQKARAGNGKPKAHFEGGQTPLTMRYPKRGFTNPLKQNLVPLNLERLQHWIDRGLIDPSRPITMHELFQSRCIHGIQDGVKLLGDGAEHFRTPNVNITVSKASQSAISAIEALGGTLVARYENRLTLRALTRPESFFAKGLDLPGKANPISRRELLYYSNEKNRGYLAIERLADRGEREQAHEPAKAEEDKPADAQI